MAKVKDVLQALDDLTGGRCVKDPSDWSSGKNRFVVTKTSSIPGKSCTEIPGLVWGDPEMEVRKIAVCMTVTESVIELAAATGVNAIISHHPACDAANFGGVLMKTYLGLYHLAFFELHEALHGTHPGIPFLHGHKPFFTDVNYGGIPGNVVNVGNALPEVKTVGDLLDRLDGLIDADMDRRMLALERRERHSDGLQETAVAACAKILVGRRENPVKQIIHIHPHCGITAAHLEQLYRDNPEADTVVASISHVYPGNELLGKAEELGLNFLCGNSHALEIFENGVPLAYALRKALPECEVVIFRERQTAIPLDEVGSPAIRAYGQSIADQYLPKK